MPEKSNHDKQGERIAKIIARAGLASRREAEAWIAAGRVAVNGALITSPALNVRPRDRVTVDGEPLPRRARTRLFRYHKPRGLVTSHADPQGRDTIFHSLPKRLPRVISIGRLDINTEGLLLLTNDGGLARVLELPATGWLRRYRVRALGRVTQEALDRLRGGITIQGVRYGPVEATLDREQGANVWLTFSIREGKNREVRKVLESLGLKVNRLIRLAYGPFELGELDEGAVEEADTASLREALGPELIEAAKADFEGPLEDERQSSRRHPEVRARGTREPRRMAGTAGAVALRGPRTAAKFTKAAPATAQPPQGDGESAAHNRNDKTRGTRHPNKRRRPDRSGGPRPSRPKPK
ncbi:MAG TPA: pseudouridine synthase [Pseudolabrys sp.]|nr:pseudouridine synthase [Pseudolabrys sp.]